MKFDYGRWHVLMRKSKKTWTIHYTGMSQVWSRIGISKKGKGRLPKTGPKIATSEFLAMVSDPTIPTQNGNLLFGEADGPAAF